MVENHWSTVAAHVIRTGHGKEKVLSWIPFAVSYVFHIKESKNKILIEHDDDTNLSLEFKMNPLYKFVFKNYCKLCKLRILNLSTSNISEWQGRSCKANKSVFILGDV
jgi:hypothetical protein